MGKILLTTSIALAALSSAAYAEPVALTDAQMDTVTAGAFYTYRREGDYDTAQYREYQNQAPYYYSAEQGGFVPYDNPTVPGPATEERFYWWYDYPEQIYFRYQQDGVWQYVPYALYQAPENGGPYTNQSPPPTF